MADDKIVIQITLDDGSILKGFANLENKAKQTGSKLEKSITGKAFDELKDSAESAVPALGRVASMFPSIMKFAGPLVAMLFGLKKAFDFSLEGEKLGALEKRFDQLAKREGIAGDVLKEELRKAGGGLISVNDLYQSATRSIAIFGDQAARLPELLEVAKKSASTLGIDTIQNFEDLSKAVETGNQKALKNAGIIIDVNKVYTDFAMTLGITANELSETQKQAAMMDAVIKEGSKTFKGITSDITPLSNATKILGVAFSDLGEKIKTSFSRAFADDFAYLTLRVAGAISSLTGTQTAQSQVTLYTAKIERLNKQIADLGKTIEYAQTRKLDMSAQMDASRAATTLSFLKKELIEVQALLAKEQAAIPKDKAGETPSALKPKKQGLTPEQLEAERQRAAQIAGFISQNEAQVIASREKLLTYETDADNRRAMQAQILNDRRLQLENEQNLKLSEINKTYSDANGFSEQQRQEARLAVIQSYSFKRAELEASSNEQSILLQKQMAERQAIIQNGLVNVISQGAVKMAQALLKGGNAFEEFGKSIVGIIADEVVKLGQALLIQGLAIETFVTSINSLLPGSGAAAAAAGMGLILFGTALKAAVGGGAPSGATPSVTPGSATTSAPVGETTSTAFEPNINQGTKVAVTIQGNVFDSAETGLRIVDIMNNAFQNQGAVLVSQA